MHRDTNRSQTINVSGGKGGHGGGGGTQGRGGAGGAGTGPILNNVFEADTVRIVMNDHRTFHLSGETGVEIPRRVVTLGALDAGADPTPNPDSDGAASTPPPSFPHGGTFITATNVNYCRPKRPREEDIDDDSLTQREYKRRRQEEDGFEIIQNTDITLKCEIGSGRGYLLHVGQNEGRVFIVKVFNKSPTARQQLESTVAFSKGLMHPNVLQIKGISPRESLVHFIAYENVHWKNAEGSLAAALKEDLDRSVTLGFKMIAGIAAGMNYLSKQEVCLGSMGVENFDVFLDLDDRFLISINPPSPDFPAEYQESQENRSWHVFNALCQKVLNSANRVIHKEEIKRDPLLTLDLLPPNSAAENLLGPFLSFGTMRRGLQKVAKAFLSQIVQPVEPRREYVWRTMDRGQQSLATIAPRITSDLEMNLSSLQRLRVPDKANPYAHRCTGYIREEITLATRTLDSAVVVHDTPSALEICPICLEVVALNIPEPPQGQPQHGGPPQLGPPRGPPGAQGMKLGNDDESDDDDEVNFHPDVNANALNTVRMPLPPAPPSSTENLFTTEFIQSVANGLDEFVDVGLFRGDGDLNLERDFGQWFNPDDEGMELGKP